MAVIGNNSNAQVLADGQTTEKWKYIQEKLFLYLRVYWISAAEICRSRAVNAESRNRCGFLSIHICSSLESNLKTFFSISIISRISDNTKL